MRKLIPALLTTVMATALSFSALATPTLAVLPFSQNTVNRTVENIHVHGSSITKDKYKTQSANSGFDQALDSVLSKDSRIKLLDRRSLESVLKEQKFNEQGYTNQQNSVQVGKLLGAEYLVTGRVNQLQAYVGKEKAAYSSMFDKVYKGEANITFQLVDSQTGVIQYSGQYLTTNNIIKAQPNETNEGFSATFKNKVANQVASEILSQLFPMKVMRESGKDVYINAGSALLNKGDKLAVYRQGQPLKDPDSGKVLGVSKQQIGTATVTQVNGNYSVATLQSSQQAKAGDLAELVQTPPKPNLFNADVKFRPI